MITKNEYEPDIVSWPGETLADVLEERQMTQVELAERMGRPKKTINEIIQGKTGITPEMALQLEHVLHIPATFWNNRQLQYAEYLAKQAERDRLKSQVYFFS
jgi:addiction module HigA family antidote